MQRRQLVWTLTQFGKGTLMYYASLTDEELEREFERWGNGTLESTRVQKQV